MIPKTIHQIFWNFKGKELEEIDVFRESVDETKRFCEEHEYIYKMWNKKDCEELICDKYPEYIQLWTDFRYDIQQCDFIRYLILHNEGGWYVDCDVYPIQHLGSISHFNEVFTTWEDDIQRKPYNAVMASLPNNSLFIKIANDVESRVYEKQNIKIYEKWKGRLVFQTTGHRMLKQNVPDKCILNLMLIHNEKKKIYVSSSNPYFYDNNASIWHSGGL